MTRAYYNEHDPFAAEWLRMLIACGHIADGDVDIRSIEDVRPSELRGYCQIHLFAGIGGWSRAFRLAGVPDSYPLWSCSCPCQPFSAAGKGMGFADERHLWPAAYHLISQCEPIGVVGEQVAAKSALSWIDLVQTDMEAAGYAFGKVDLCAAGIGAPHIRQRLYWCADSLLARRESRRSTGTALGYGSPFKSDCSVGVGSDANSSRCGKRRPIQEGDWPRETREQLTGLCAAACVWSDSWCKWLGCQAEQCDDSIVTRLQGHCGNDRTGFLGESETRSVAASGATRGFWSPADWWYGRDQKYRPIEPGLFPLAHGVPKRMGRLRGYGNAIVPQIAAEFVRAYMESIRRLQLMWSYL